MHLCISQVFVGQLLRIAICFCKATYEIVQYGIMYI